MSNRMPNKIPKDISNKMLEDLSDKISEDISKYILKKYQIEGQIKYRKIC